MANALVDAAVLSGAARSLPLAWLAGLRVLPFPTRSLDAQVPGAAHAEGLLVRTATRVDAGTLDALPALRALATLSSGTDHLDLAALAARGIQLHTGHGGNARAVADWVLWALARLPTQNRRALVVGVGAVGSAVSAALRAEGWQVTCCDPPRAARERGFAQVDLDAALADGPWGVVTLHVPLVADGPWPTVDLLSAPRLARLHGCVVLQAARGGVLDEDAALALRADGRLAGLAVDTFVQEPQPNPQLLRVADLVTPHVAGHSMEGKLDVAHRAVSGWLRALGVDAVLDLPDAIRAARTAAGAVDLTPHAALDAAHQALRADPARFESIRHGHLRVETGLLPRAASVR